MPYERWTQLCEDFLNKTLNKQIWIPNRLQLQYMIINGIQCSLDKLYFATEGETEILSQTYTKRERETEPASVVTSVLLGMLTRNLFVFFQFFLLSLPTDFCFIHFFRPLFSRFSLLVAILIFTFTMGKSRYNFIAPICVISHVSCLPLCLVPFCGRFWLLRYPNKITISPTFIQWNAHNYILLHIDTLHCVRLDQQKLRNVLCVFNKQPEQETQYTMRIWNILRHFAMGAIAPAISPSRLNWKEKKNGEQVEYSIMMSWRFISWFYAVCIYLPQ